MSSRGGGNMRGRGSPRGRGGRRPSTPYRPKTPEPEPWQLEFAQYPIVEDRIPRVQPPDLHFVAPLRQLRLSDNPEFGSSFSWLLNARHELNKAMTFASNCEKRLHPESMEAKVTRRAFHLYWQHRVRTGQFRPSQAGPYSVRERLFRSEELTDELEAWRKHCAAMSRRLREILQAAHQMEYIKMLAVQRLREGVAHFGDVDAHFVEGGWVNKRRGDEKEKAMKCLAEAEVDEQEGAQWYRLLEYSSHRGRDLQNEMEFIDDVDFPEPWKSTHTRRKEYNLLEAYVYFYLDGCEPEIRHNRFFASWRGWIERYEPRYRMVQSGMYRDDGSILVQWYYYDAVEDSMALIRDCKDLVREKSVFVSSAGENISLS